MFPLQNRLRTVGAFLESVPQPNLWKGGFFLWGVFALVLLLIVAIQPDRRTVTPEYRGAAEKWWASAPAIYQGKSGFLYLPQAAVIYTPFALLPKRIGEPLWRLAGISLLAGALAQASKRLSTHRSGSLFFWATLLVIPASLSSARNGQNNLPLAALYLIAATALADKKWNLASLLLIITLALKPISVVAILLVAAVYPPTIIPLVLWGIGLFASGFLHPSPAYVIEQYREFGESLLRSGRPTRHDFCDFAGAFRSFGLPLPSSVQFLVRAFFAAFALWVARHSLSIKGIWRSAYSVMLLAALYLMIFNPRTETNSYVILAAFVALIGAYAIAISHEKKMVIGMVFLCLALASDSAGWPIFPLTNLWLKAVVAAIFGAWFAFRILEGKEILPPEVSPTGK